MSESIAGFVKSWSTTVAAEKSKRDLEATLRRYGASGFTVSNDYAGRTVVIAFSVPRSLQIKSAANEHVEIRIPVSYAEVQRRLETIPTFANKRDEAWKQAQAERVAWRHLVILCEAALMAAALGVQTLDEAFFAHQMIALPNGNQVRAMDAISQVRRLTSGS